MAGCQYSSSPACAACTLRWPVRSACVDVGWLARVLPPAGRPIPSSTQWPPTIWSATAAAVLKPAALLVQWPRCWWGRARTSTGPSSCSSACWRGWGPRLLPAPGGCRCQRALGASSCSCCSASHACTAPAGQRWPRLVLSHAVCPCQLHAHAHYARAQLTSLSSLPLLSLPAACSSPSACLPACCTDLPHLAIAPYTPGRSGRRRRRAWACPSRA